MILLLAVSLLAAPYIQLAVDISFGSRHLDTPVADLAATALVAVCVVSSPLLQKFRLLRSTGSESGHHGAFRPPGLWAYAALVGVALVALAVVPDRGASAWFLLRKPVFFYVAYGLALAWTVSATPVPTVRRIVRLCLLTISIVSIISSVGRISVGNTLWFQAIEGLTNNHKTLAVASAPLVALLVSMRRSRADLVVSAVAICAIALSLSRTSWIALAAGLAFVIVWRGRRLAARRGLVAGVVILGVLAALYGPLLTGSHAQLDAARSRHSLDKRAWTLFQAAPLVGAGGGANVRYEMATFPHYRVNGVDAHGAVQKVASEYGAVGLLAWLGFVASSGRALWRRAAVHAPLSGWLAPADLRIGVWSAFVALHVNLLLSTETFSQTHWAVFGLVWGLSFRVVAPGPDLAGQPPTTPDES